MPKTHSQCLSFVCALCLRMANRVLTEDQKWKINDRIYPNFIKFQNILLCGVCSTCRIGSLNKIEDKTDVELK